MYPQLDFDLPIVSMDLVMKDGRASLGIIDPCPVAMDRSLPSAYNQIARHVGVLSVAQNLTWKLTKDCWF